MSANSQPGSRHDRNFPRPLRSHGVFEPADHVSASQFKAEGLVAAKRDLLVSVCIPARNEAETVGQVAGAVVEELIVRYPLVDEVIVMDDRSSDDTAAVARAAGARVVAVADVLPQCGEGRGKGEVLWKSLAASRGDLVVWCDADVQGFSADFVTGLLGPLLLHPHLSFVKGFYHRPLHGRSGEGGRVTELLARPLIAELFPTLVEFSQPLAGEFAGRRALLERLPFAAGYGVDLGLLVDAAAEVGPSAMAQVDLGTRVHRNRPLSELTLHARDVLAAALDRAPQLASSSQRSGADRPPLITVVGYRRWAS